MRENFRKSLLIMFWLAGCAAFTVGQQATGAVRGRVIYAENDSPLHNVSVQIVQLKRTTETDDAGNYEFTGVPSGTYTLLTHLEGFPDATQQIKITAGNALTADFRMQITGVREQVTVTATGSEQAIADSFQSVSAVDSTRILEQASTSIGDVLERETGIAKRSFGPGSSRPVVRGFDGDRVLVLQDGVRTGSLGSQSGDHGEPIDPLALERLEVVRGPGTLLYGSNALGGVVNAVSGHEIGRHEGTRGYFSTIAGTNSNQFGVSGGAEYGRGAWLVWANGTGQRTGDYSSPLGRVDNSKTRNGGGSAGVGYFGNRYFGTFAYTYDNRRYGIPFAGLIEGDPDLDIDIDMRRNNARFTTGFRDVDAFVTGFNFKFDITDYKHNELEITPDATEIGTRLTNRTYSYRGVFTQQKRGHVTGSFGFEGFRRNYNSTGEEALIPAPVNQNSFSLFALEEIGTERVAFQLGGRYERNAYQVDGDILPSRTFNGFSGAAGVRFGLWQGGAFVVNYSHSERAPALEELYNNGPHAGNVTFEIGDNNLRRERSDGIEFVLRHTAQRFRAEGSYYYYRLNNYVFLAPTGDFEDGLPVANYLQSDSRYTGVEATFEAGVNKYLWLLGGIDYVNAQLTSGTPLPRIPPLRGRLGLDARYGNLSVRPEVILTRDQDRVFPTETRTAGYGTVNLAASYTLPHPHYAHIFAVNAFNLNDKLYRNHLSFIKEFAPEIGRGVRFSYTVRFF